MKNIRLNKLFPTEFTGEELEMFGSAMPYKHAIPGAISDNDEETPYYWWWQYLKRNKNYEECCHRHGTGRLSEVYQDWGDIYSHDFESWMLHHGEHLFSERDVGLSEVTGEFDFKNLCWESNAALVFPTHVAGTPLTEKAIRAQFEKFILSKFGPDDREYYSTAKYRVTGKYDPRILKEMLAVYDLRMHSAKTFWEIGRELVDRNLISIGGAYVTSDKEIDATSRDALGKITSRYFKNAENYIRNSVGRAFPSDTLIKGIK